jgi:hypothetical protein
MRKPFVVGMSTANRALRLLMHAALLAWTTALLIALASR